MEVMQVKIVFGRELNGCLRKGRESKIVGIINFKKWSKIWKLKTFKDMWRHANLKHAETCDIY